MGTSIVSPKSKTLVPDTTSADDNSIAAAQTPGGASNLTLLATASTFAPTRVGLFVTVTGDGATDLRATNFTITGTNALGISASEVLAGPNGAATVTSTLKYNTVTQIAVSGGTTTAVRAGNAAGSGGSEQTVFAGRTRLRELFGTTAATANTVTTFFNGGQSQENELFAVQNPVAAQTLINPASAHGGILANEGLTVNLPTNSFVSLTVYFDGQVAMANTTSQSYSFDQMRRLRKQYSPLATYPSKYTVKLTKLLVGRFTDKPSLANIPPCAEAGLIKV